MPTPAIAHGARGPEPPPELLAALAARAGTDGFLPFDRYMDVVLYHPRVGYYARSRTPLGPEGDFYTAGRVHPMYARALAARIAEVARRVPSARPFSVVDLGSGDGALLAPLARELARRSERTDWRFVVVDRSAARAEGALAAVTAAVQGTGAPALAARALAEVGPLAGVVLGHELLDAQPARRLVWNGRAWRELGARLRDGRLEPSDRASGPVAGPKLPTVAPADAGTVLEVSPAAEGLVREVADHLAAGLLVLVDFGAEERELLAAHAGGTLAAVRAHRPLAGPWDAPGDSDLSTFVNFTRIRAVAGRAGLGEVAYRSQAEALAAWGIEAEIARAESDARSDEEKVKVRLAAKSLLFGFGTFRVLELAPRASGAALAEPATPASSAGPS